MDIHDMSAEDILRASDVDARIAELKASCEADWERDNLTEEEQDDLRDREEEMDDLARFRDEVSGQVKWRPESMTFIRDSYFEKYAAEKARDLYGEAAETPYWDDEKWAEDLQENFQEITLDGTTYLYDGN